MRSCALVAAALALLALSCLFSASNGALASCDGLDQLSCFNLSCSQACGWCEGYGCVRGNNSGPANSTQCPADATWTFPCGDCESHGGGVNCTRSFGCGQCGDGVCQPGDSYGPFDSAPCRSGWHFDECVGQSQADCCARSHDCGWCDGYGCVRGDCYGTDCPQSGSFKPCRHCAILTVKALLAAALLAVAAAALVGGAVFCFVRRSAAV